MGGGLHFLSVCLLVSLPPPLAVHALTCVQVSATPLMLWLTLFLGSLFSKADSIGVHRVRGAGDSAQTLICQACLTHVTKDKCQAPVCQILHTSM